MHPRETESASTWLELEAAANAGLKEKDAAAVVRRLAVEGRETGHGEDFGHELELRPHACREADAATKVERVQRVLPVARLDVIGDARTEDDLVATELEADEDRERGVHDVVCLPSEARLVICERQRS